MKKLVSIRIMVLLIVICLAVLVMPLSATGKDKVVNVSYSVDLTGPLSVGIKPMLSAGLDYWRMVNEAGGVQGVKVNPLWADTAYSLPKCLIAYKRFKQRGTIIHYTANSTENESFKNRWARDQVVTMTVAITAPCVEPPAWIYVPSLFYEPCYSGIQDYIKKIWKGEGNPKLGLLTYDIPATKTVRDIYPPYGKHVGVDVKVEIMPLNPIDLTAQLSRLKAWGANYVFVIAMSGDPALVLKDANKIGFDTTVIATLEPYTITMAGDLSEGMMMWADTASFVEDLPGIKQIKAIQMKYHGKLMEEEQYVRAWVATMASHKALEIALKDVGFEKISGAAVKAAIHKIKDFDTGGLTPPLSWAGDPNKRAGTHGLQFFEVRNGKPVPMSGWLPTPTWEEVKSISGWKPK